ncbi:unnamed protein product [Kuraishia capsulata CBS 1993]|uniref:Calcium-transporting ATPase n=1 Tax=Kuraishia capsulata CBS 1993 TaxID=1382522 RepID=W6MUB2_9ASCO|nr:uncharacterized protein KUCA_T00005069001 [Kuraishia capsulata CBS 1993]CDK29082.1 unnamed protein product [Kuraishia capsulata CBS 1993]
MDPTTSTAGGHASRFSLSPADLSGVLDPKSIRALLKLGGIEGLVAKLATDRSKGLSASEDLSLRKSQYGENFLPPKVSRSFLGLCYDAMKDKILIMLSVAAVVSLALGLYETFGQPAEIDSEGKKEPKVEWVEGVAIIVAIVIVVVVGAVNDYNKERQFAKLNSKKEDRTVVVIRDSSKVVISIKDVVVGDLLVLEVGDVIPADGILVDGTCECDESSLTGETNTIIKVPADVAENWIHNQTDDSLDLGIKGCPDPMVISGSKLLSGQATALVVSVGEHSLHGKIMSSLQIETEETPLQVRLNGLADGIAKFGLIAALILFIVLFIKFCVSLNGEYKNFTGPEKGTKFLNILITAITIVVVAVPEGLPLAVTLALAFATTRMAKDGNLVRVLKSCEVMGGATAVCSDKTGTLTENKMKVVKGLVGTASFDDTHNNSSIANSPAVIQETSNDLINSLKDNILLNSTAFETVEEVEDEVAAPTGLFSKFKKPTEERKTEKTPYVGSKTESALLIFSQNFHDYSKQSLSEFRRVNSDRIVQVIPFESSRKWGGIVVKTSWGFRLYIKGAAELVFDRCKSRIAEGGEVKAITSDSKAKIDSTINSYAEGALRTLTLAHRDFKGVSDWPPRELRQSGLNIEAKPIADPELLFGEVTERETLDTNESREQGVPMIFVGNEVDSATESNDGLILDAIVGIQDPLRPGVKSAISKCAQAGVRVRMVTGDSVVTARAISMECGILDEENVSVPESCMEGPKFRALSERDRIEIVPRLCVLARSSPEDKRVLVDTLRKLGEVVAVTGDGTNDAPALKLADVGFSMGIAGTEVAREASDIILMTDDFSAIVDAIKWGRTVSCSIRKFVQFQLTVNVTAVVLTFVSAVADSEGRSVLTAVQLLWVNLIMDTLAALALATDKPDDSLLNRKPAGRTAPLISVSMWKMIFGQSFVQLIITFVLHFAGGSIFFGSDVSDHQKEQISALTFNAFVWLQFFNLFLTRKLDEGDGLTKIKERITMDNLNFTSHLFRNWYFISIAVIIGGFQILIMFVGGAAFSIAHQTGGMWGTAIICGILSLPWGVVIRIIPDVWASKVFPTRAYLLVSKLWTRRKKVKDVEKQDSEAGNASDPVYKAKEYLTVNPPAKGGSLRDWWSNRSRTSSESTLYGGQSSSVSFQTDDASSAVPSTVVASIIPSVVGGSVAGWHTSEQKT